MRIKQTNMEPEQVEKIEISEKHIPLRIVLFVLFFVIAIVAIAVGIFSLRKKDNGWVTFSNESGNEISNCCEDFQLNYELGKGSMSATEENKLVYTTYVNSLEYTYKEFDIYKEYSDIVNMYSINHNPNTDLVVSSLLYTSLKKVYDTNPMLLYMGPIYTIYTPVFYSESEEEAKEIDPRYNQNLQVEINKILEYIKKDSIKLEFKENNTISLILSADYKTYLDENELTNYIDFGWLTNALKTDYLAGCLKGQNLYHGFISTFDGYFVDLDSSHTYTGSLLDCLDDTVLSIAEYKINGAVNIVQLRSFPTYVQNKYDYFWYDNKEFTNYYINTTNGMCEYSIEQLTSYSYEKNCTEIAIAMYSVFVNNTFDLANISSLKDNSIASIWRTNMTIYSNDENIEITPYQSTKYQYTVEKIA